MENDFRRLNNAISMFFYLCDFKELCLKTGFKIACAIFSEKSLQWHSKLQIWNHANAWTCTIQVLIQLIFFFKIPLTILGYWNHLSSGMKNMLTSTQNNECQWNTANEFLRTSCKMNIVSSLYHQLNLFIWWSDSVQMLYLKYWNRFLHLTTTVVSSGTFEKYLLVELQVYL